MERKIFARGTFPEKLGKVGCFSVFFFNVYYVIFSPVNCVIDRW